MSCHKFVTPNGDVGYICMRDAYRFEGWFFEHHKYHGVILLKKNGEPRDRPTCERSKFWASYERFTKLKDEQKEEYRV